MKKRAAKYQRLKTVEEKRLADQTKAERVTAERAEEEQLYKKDKDAVIVMRLAAIAVIAREMKAAKEKEENKKMMIAFIKAEEKRAVKTARKAVRAQHKLGVTVINIKYSGDILERLLNRKYQRLLFPYTPLATQS